MVLQRGAHEYKQDEPAPILKNLQVSGAGSKLTSYLKGMQQAGKKGSLKEFHKVAVPSLPPDVTAAGIRPGSCDTMILAGVPPEIACHASGHDLTPIGALFNYLNSRLPLLMMCAVPLLGWLPFKRCEIERGPVVRDVPMGLRTGRRISDLVS